MIKRLLKFILYLGVILFLVAIYFYYQADGVKNPTFGITYSHTYAASLGYDPMQAYMDILTDLKPKKLRLVAYWDEIEKEQGKFDFKNLDFMLEEAGKRNVDVIMTVGRKVPRWPECHQPEWYKQLDAKQQEEVLMKMLSSTVEHLKKYDAIKSWQVENEPYFVFGIDCPLQSEEMVKKEVALVRSLDPRPIVLTGSGEQGNWNDLAEAGADIVGVTMYRTVYNDKLGYYKYPVGPWFYRIKAGVVKKFENKPVIGVELQTEPWLLSGIFHTSVEEQKSLMNQKIFADHVEYAKGSGFTEHYLWGVEWWYWMAKQKNEWGMWAYAKDLFAQNQ